MMKNSYKVLTIRGIDIYLHWTWILAFTFITWSLSRYYAHTFPDWSGRTALLVAAISALLLFVTVLLHELAHAFTARAHELPVQTITLFIFGGAANLTQEPETPRVELLVAIAGPLTSLALAGIFFVLHQLGGGLSEEVLSVLGYLASVNLILALFNLIPGFPLDGGRVLRASIWWVTGRLQRATQIASIIGQGIGYLFMFGGIYQAFVLGTVGSGLWLVFIGWFLQNAASASYQQAVMEHLFRGVDVRRVMDRTPASVPPNTSVANLVDLHMLSQNQRAVPVQDLDGRLAGLVTLGDVRNVDRDEWNVTPVSRIMQPRDKLCTVSITDDLGRAMRVLAENGYHQLPVMEDGRMVGMLNRAHVLQYLQLREQLGAASSRNRDGY
jgi:Zn-dependent protease